MKRKTSGIPVQCSTNWELVISLIRNILVEVKWWKWIYKKYIFERRVEEWISEWTSQLCTQIKQLRKESLKKIQAWTGFRTHDLCDTGAVLYQLSYQASWEMVISR